MQLRAGDPETIGGYTIRSRLGSGGMGTVFLASSPSGRRVALKLIHAQFLDDDEFRSRFRQEVAAARRVSGAFTAAVVDADPDGDPPWMATTYIAGPTLAQRVTENGTLHGAELRTLAIGLVEALRDIHRAGVVHRDLKPSNVVLSQDGPRVIDFGISRATDHQTLTMTGRLIGTPPFMSPEQLQSPRQVGTESDVFSVATVLVYAATGQGPFHADSPYIAAYQVVHKTPQLSGVPGALRAVVEPCLAKDPGSRPTADELLRQLSALPVDLFPPSEEQAEAAERQPRATGAPYGSSAPSGSTAPSGAPAGTGGDNPPASATGHEAATHRSGTAAVAPDGSTWGAGAGAAVPDAHSGGDANSHGAAHAHGDADSDGGADSDAAGTGLGARPGAAGPSASAGASVRTVPVGSRRSPGPPSAARGPRRRWRWRWQPLVAVALAVAAISTGVTLFASGQLTGYESAGAAGEGQGAASAPDEPPSGFRPWQRTVPGGRNVPDQLRCAPHGDSVYCGGGGVLAVRLRVKDGTQVWKRTSPGVPEAGVHFVGVSGDTVVGYRIADSGPNPLQVVGLSAADGEELWSAGVSDDTAVFTGEPMDAALLGGTVFSVDPGRTRIEARRTDTGALRWSTPFPAGSQCVPVTAGPHAYAMCAPNAEVHELGAMHPSFRTLDPQTGRLGRPLQVDGRLLPVGAADDGSLVVLRERAVPTGYEGYTHVLRLDPRAGRARSAPLHDTGGACGLAGGTLYCSGEEGLVRAVDPATGKARWQTQTDLETPAGPVVANGTLYLSSLSGRVVAIDDRSGRLKWSTTPRSKTIGDETTVLPRVVETRGVVVVAAPRNLLFGFSAAHPPGQPDDAQP